MRIRLNFKYCKSSRYAHIYQSKGGEVKLTIPRQIIPHDYAPGEISCLFEWEEPLESAEDKKRSKK